MTTMITTAKHTGFFLFTILINTLRVVHEKLECIQKLRYQNNKIIKILIINKENIENYVNLQCLNIHKLLKQN